MKVEQLKHLPKLPSSDEGSHRVHEKASLTGILNSEPITLCIIGVFHREADPRGLPQCDVYSPDCSEDYLVYVGSRHDVGKPIAMSETRRISLSDLRSYQSGDVNVKPRRLYSLLLNALR